MSEISDDLYQRLHGFKAVQRISSDSDKSNWYYIDPRYEEGNPHREIDVNNENEVNPLLKEVLAYDVWKNPSEYYIWQTVGDERVRPEHEEHDGYAFNWHIPSENGYPGSERNCRCSAISYSPKKHKVITVDLRGLNIGDDEDDLIITINNAFINQVLSETLYKDNEVDYSLYGEGFTKEFIDQMLNDERFQRAVEATLENEGGYTNNPLDLGGETNYGISARIYSDENIKEITKERAKAIYYRDYWINPKIYMLPDELAYIVFDDGVIQGQPTAIKNLQRALEIEADGVIGTKTLKALKQSNYKLVKEGFIKNVYNVENKYLKKNPSQKIFEKGHKKRFDKY